MDMAGRRIRLVAYNGVGDTDIYILVERFKEMWFMGLGMYIGLGMGAFMDGKVCCIGNWELGRVLYRFQT